MSGKDFKLDSELSQKMIEAAGEVARVTVTSPMFLEALVGEMLGKVAKGPASLLSRDPHRITKEELLTAPATLEDGRILILTEFPVDIPSSYTLLVLPGVEAPADDMPTPVGDERTVKVSEGYDGLTLIWKDNPGQIGRNHMVNLHSYEQQELERQLTAANVQGPRFLYLTSLELGHDPKDAHNHAH